MGYAPHIIMDEIATKRQKVKRAFERRFGQSVMPLAFTEYTHVNGGKCVKVLDRETGTWAEYNVSGWRIRMMREHDAMV